MSEILPSAHAVQNLYDGKDGAVFQVLGSFALRSLILAVGMRAAGIKNKKVLVRGALGGAVAIEVFVLAWVGASHRDPPR